MYAIQSLPSRQSIYQPDHHFTEPADSTFWPNMYRGGTVKETATQYGTYATLRLRLAEPLMLIVGSRVSWYENRRTSNNLAWENGRYRMRVLGKPAKSRRSQR